MAEETLKQWLEMEGALLRAMIKARGALHRLIKESNHVLYLIDNGDLDREGYDWSEEVCADIDRLKEAVHFAETGKELK